jgi:hypothetical protein
MPVRPLISCNGFFSSRLDGFTNPKRFVPLTRWGWDRGLLVGVGAALEASDPPEADYRRVLKLSGGKGDLPEKARARLKEYEKLREKLLTEPTATPSSSPQGERG